MVESRKKSTGRPAVGSSKSKDGYIPFGLALGARIRRVRMRKGLTLKDVADATRGVVALSTLANIEYGLIPKLDIFLAICGSLGIRPMVMIPKEFRGV